MLGRVLLKLANLPFPPEFGSYYITILTELLVPKLSLEIKEEEILSFEALYLSKVAFMC